MQPLARRHAVTIQVFEDRQTPSLKQRTFPYRRHSATRKSSTPATIWRQPSLTQTVPTLARFSSTLPSFDGADDLEYDSLKPAMPPKKKRRKSTTDKSTPDQTKITQMDPFRRQLHPEDDPQELKEDYSSIVDTPPPITGRRRVSHTPATSKVQTRSAKKKILEAESVKRGTKSPHLQRPDVVHPEQGTDTSLPESQGVQMPPPATPKRIRRKVIPSSQSPADTPLSSRRHKCKDSTGNPEMTPLQERSANTPSRTRASSRRKTVQWAPKLLVADSTNLENEDLEDPFPLIFQSSHTAKDSRKGAPPSTLRDLSKLRFPSTPVHRAHSLNRDTPKAPFNSSKDKKATVIKRTGTIADSEDEDNASLDRSPVKYTTDVQKNFEPTPPSVTPKKPSRPPKPPNPNLNNSGHNT
ncbi:MAG: hypothetical protein LQ341_002782, partial [Variospora aurantia]